MTIDVKDVTTSTIMRKNEGLTELSLSNENENDSVTCRIVSDQSTACSSSSSDSISDDDDENQQDEQQDIHPLKQQKHDRHPLSLNASGTTFRKLHERSDSGQLRSKLLMKLGIDLGNMSLPGSSTGPSNTSTEASRIVQKGQEDAYNIALKTDHGQVDRALQRSKKSFDTLSVLPGDKNTIQEKPMSTASTTTVTKTTKRGCVSFDASVKVHPIPARSDYSKRMRSVMWVSSTELQQNAARNSLEFAAEEWDVSKVVNDEDMILYGGERIHPIHFVQHQMALSSSVVDGAPPRDW